MSVFDKDSSTLGRYAVSTGKLLQTFRGGDHPASFLYYVTLKMELNYYTKTPVGIYQSTRRNMQENFKPSVKSFTSSLK